MNVQPGQIIRRTPGGDGLKVLDVPGVIGHAEKTHFTGFCMFHGVGNKAAHLVLHVRMRIQTIGAAQGKAAALEVVSGPVPPDECGALDVLVDPALSL